MSRAKRLKFMMDLSLTLASLLATLALVRLIVTQDVINGALNLLPLVAFTVNYLMLMNEYHMEQERSARLFE